MEKLNTGNNLKKTLRYNPKTDLSDSYLLDHLAHTNNVITLGEIEVVFVGACHFLRRELLGLGKE